MRRIPHPDPENTHMFRAFGLKPSQTEVGGRLVCTTHDYSEPDQDGMQHCHACGCSRHQDSQI